MTLGPRDSRGAMLAPRLRELAAEEQPDDERADE